MSDLLPILKNRQEFQKQKSRGMYVEELFGNENSPILMYGEDKGAYIAYNQSTSENEDKQIKELAIKNLENIEVPFHVEVMQGFKIAMAEHEYAAEKILDKNYMKKLAAELDSNSIVVGIPMKGFLVAVAKGQGEANLYGAIVQQYQNAQTYPISNSMYYIIGGEIEMMGGNSNSGAINDENGLLEVTGINDAKGKIGFIAKVGNKNEGELANQIQTAFQNILLHGMKDAKNFNGKIDFHISPDFNPLTSSLEEQIKTMAKNISERGAVQIMGGLSEEEFKVRFFYGEDKLIGETFETEPVQLKNNVKNPKPYHEMQNSNPMNYNKSEKKSWWKFW